MDSAASATTEARKPVRFEQESYGERAELRRQILRLAGPALVEYFLLSFAGMVNMIMVGSLGATAITAVGITNQPVFFVQAIFISLSVGTTALVARSIGAGDRESAKRFARQSMVATAILSVLITLPQVFLARLVVTWMGAEPKVVDLATGYMQVMVLGTLMTAVPLTTSAILRGAGDTRTPMALNILTNVMNAAFGYVLIYGYLGLPRLGVLGAGIGTVLARTVITVLYVRMLYRPGSVVPVSFKDSHRIDPDAIRRIMSIGVPAAIEQFVIRGGQTMFSRTVASLGTLSYAAHQLTVNAESLAFNPPMAFQVASTTLTGQYLGAKNPGAAEKSGYENLRMSLALMALIGTFCYVFAPQIMRLYTSDAQVVNTAVPNMRLFSIALPGMASHFVLVGALRGAGDTKWPLYVSLVCMWVFRVFGSYMLAIYFGLGLRGAWIAMVVDHCFRASLSFFRFRSGGWKHVRV